MGPPSHKEFILMFSVQIHLRYFNLGSMIHLLVVLMFLSVPVLGDTGTRVTYFYNQLLYPGNNILPQWGSVDGFANALPVILLPLL